MSDPANKVLFPRRWAAIVVAILFTHTSFMILAVVIFVRHHEDGVIPNYYEKAVHWDEIKARQWHETVDKRPTMGD